MAHCLNVYAVASLADPKEMAGDVAVVIDVLRAATSIVSALDAGAKGVIPVLEVDEAVALAKRLPDGEALLGGERGGLPIDGFDLGNSPGQYVRDVVGGKTVVFTTTNGTSAIHRARRARRVLIAAFVNATAVADALLGQERIHLICSGTQGQYSDDDVLLAGMLVDRIDRQGGAIYELNAQAITARETWLHRFPLPQALGGEPLDPERLADQLRGSLAGKRLAALGLEDDILRAARLDCSSSVPELHAEEDCIRLAR